MKEILFVSFRLFIYFLFSREKLWGFYSILGLLFKIVFIELS